MRVLFGLGLLLAALLPVRAQQSLPDSSIALTLLEITYQGSLPGGDFGERFGYTSQMGLGVAYKFRSQWYVGGHFHLLFGGGVKEDSMLRYLTTPADLLINEEGLLSAYALRQWGGTASLRFGRQFPVAFSPNPNSGLYLEVGFGAIAHRITPDAIEGPVPAIEGDYRKGYDRLTFGWGLTESVGYRYFGNKGYVNFSIGLDFGQYFTQGQRSVQFDSGLPYDASRREFLYGFHVSWIFPLYERAATVYFW